MPQSLVVRNWEEDPSRRMVLFQFPPKAIAARYDLKSSGQHFPRKDHRLLKLDSPQV